MPIRSISDITNVYYINLKHRTDRKEHVETELLKIGLSATRFNAIKTTNGAIGCSLSHAALIRSAITKGMDHILIVEDDIEFLNPELFASQLNKFLKNHSNWDVVMFAGNNVPPYEDVDDTCIKVSRCLTTTGYLVNRHYFNNLYTNLVEGVNEFIRNPNKKNKYAIDVFWKSLQEKDNWFLITPLTVVQREDYSDIEERTTNYKELMTDIDKQRFLSKIQSQQTNKC